MHIRVFPLGDGPTWPPPAGPGTSQARPVAGIPRVTGGVPTTSHRGRAFLGSRGGYRKVHFMRFKNSYAAAVAAAVSAVVFSAAFQPAEASFVFYAEQVGPNVVITGSGSFITSGSVGPGGAIPFSTNLFFPLAANVGAESLTTGSFVAAPTAVYAPLFSSTQPNVTTLSATAAAITASSSSGPILGFSVGTFGTPSGYLGLEPSYVSGSLISNSATYNSTTLSAFGWTAGTYGSPVVNRSYTLSNGETVQILGVPEPTHMVSVAGIGAALGAWRLRKLRRSREAAGDAIAS
jgi:hypothetical protein